MDEPVLDGKIDPVVTHSVVKYEIGRRIYAFSNQSKSWGVVELKQLLPTKEGERMKLGLTIQAQCMMIPDGDTMHVFNYATGAWTSIDTKNDR